jgi:hypothetical protein
MGETLSQWLKRLRKKADFEQKSCEGHMAGAKALSILVPLVARLKSCPFYKAAAKTC